MFVFVQKWRSHAFDNIIAETIFTTFVSLTPKVNREVCHIAIVRVCGYPHFDPIC